MYKKNPKQLTQPSFYASKLYTISIFFLILFPIIVASVYKETLSCFLKYNDAFALFDRKRKHRFYLAFFFLLSQCHTLKISDKENVS